MTIDTEALRKLLSEATPGPWKWGNNRDGIIGVFHASCAESMEFLFWEDWIDVAPAGSWCEERKPVSKEANARLITAAPELAAEVIRLRAENEQMRDALMAIQHGDDSPDGMQGDIARAALNPPDTEGEIMTPRNVHIDCTTSGA